MHRGLAAIACVFLGGFGPLQSYSFAGADDPAPAKEPAESPAPLPPAGMHRGPVEPVYPTTTDKPATGKPAAVTPASPAPAAVPSPAAPAVPAPVVATPATTPAATPEVKTPAATIPGLSPETFTVPPGRYFPEGTFLVRRTGTIRTLKTGDVAFIPDVPSKRDPRRRGERPMVLLPSQTLSAMQSAITTSPDGDKTRVEISGQLFVYRDRQQLLPTIFRVIQAAPAAAPKVIGDEAKSDTTKPEKDGKSPEGEETPSVREGDDPEIAEMISQLENSRSESHPAAASSVPEAKTGAATGAEPEKVAAARPLVPEGTLLTDRRGRLVRVGNQLAIAFDADVENAGEPAMIILRTRALERLEAAAAGKTEAAEIVFSGRVYAYRNQNYVLPVLAQFEARSQLRPLQ